MMECKRRTSSPVGFLSSNFNGFWGDAMKKHLYLIAVIMMIFLTSYPSYAAEDVEVLKESIQDG
jgi:hypothetical protein